MARILVIGGLASSLTHFRGPLMASMLSHGHEVHACAAGEHPRVAAELKEMGITYHTYSLKSTGMNPFTDIRTVASLARLYARIRPDVVLTYTIKPVIYGSFAAIIKRIPERYSMIEGLGYTFMVSNWKGRLINYLVCILYRAALKGNRKTFFLNQDDLSTFLQEDVISDREKTVLLNGIGAELDFYSPVRSPAGRMVFLLISRLMPDKGIGIFIEAARMVKSRYPQAEFKILGPMMEHPASYKQSDIEEWEREGVVEYLGVTNDVRPYIADASVFVLPSYYREGVPRTIIEAMAMARPIITTDMPGCRDTVEEGENGLLIPTHDSKALCSAMQYFLDNPEKVQSMGQKSREFAEAKYDVHKINKTIVNEMGLAGRPCHDVL